MERQTLWLPLVCTCITITVSIHPMPSLSHLLPISLFHFSLISESPASINHCSAVASLEKPPHSGRHIFADVEDDATGGHCWTCGQSHSVLSLEEFHLQPSTVWQLVISYQCSVKPRVLSPSPCHRYFVCLNRSFALCNALTWWRGQCI